MKRRPNPKKGAVTREAQLSVLSNPAMLAEVRELILSARQQVAHVVNAGLTMLYWQIGTRIREDILKETRAEYGKEIAQTLSARLTAEFGRGYSQRNLDGMVRLVEVFRDPEIVAARMRGC